MIILYVCKHKLNKTLKEVRANPDLEMSTRKKFSDEKNCKCNYKICMQEPPYSEDKQNSDQKVHEYAIKSYAKLYNITKKNNRKY